MAKLCLLLSASMLWIVPSPAAAVSPPQAKGGIPADGIIRQWTTIEINGVLDYDDGGLRPRIPEFGTWLGYSVTAEGRWFGLDFGGHKELEEKTKQLIGTRVLVNGKVEERTLEGFIKRQIMVVVVSGPEGAGTKDSIQETVNVEIQGDLKSIVHMGQPPRTAWVVQAGGKTYELEFDGSVPKEKPGSLDGKKVFVTGTLKDGTSVLATGLRDTVLR